MEMLRGGIKQQLIQLFLFVIFVNDEANCNFWPTYVEIWDIRPKLVQPSI